jgi:hypothetical protein
MLNLVFLFLQTGTFLFLLNNYFYNNFPKTYNDILINISYKFLYFYSKCQVIYLKINSTSTVHFLKYIFLKKRFQKNEIIQIKETGEINKHIFTNNSEKYFEHDNKSIYIFSDNETTPLCVNKIISHSPTILTNYELCDSCLPLFMEVKIVNESFLINLKTHTFNFWIVNNILDKKFFVYYLRNILKCYLVDEDYLNKMYVSVIDDNFNMQKFEVTDENYILIEKNKYLLKLN